MVDTFRTQHGLVDGEITAEEYARGRAARRREVRHRRVAVPGSVSRRAPRCADSSLRVGLGLAALLVGGILISALARAAARHARGGRRVAAAGDAGIPNGVGTDRPDHRVDAVGGPFPADRHGARRRGGTGRRGCRDAGGLRQPARRAGRRRGVGGCRPRCGDGDRAGSGRLRRLRWSRCSAFAGGLLATLLVYLVSRANGRTEVVTLLLTGIAVNAFAGAGLAFVLFSASAANREQIIFWQLGSLDGSLWREVADRRGGLPSRASSSRSLLGRRYDVLALGERNARHLGIDVERLRLDLDRAGRPAHRRRGRVRRHHRVRRTRRAARRAHAARPAAIAP